MLLDHNATCKKHESLQGTISMDKRMLRFYDKELAHLRAMGGEFAKEFPKIAGRLSL
ncbi:MAG: type VI secretion system baseplate subunit TssF, partial [Sedimentisphaerales bacterium]|nr:type VI secretion system baseplate subunit TssF [Sedimentisphaerales bacterium]